MTQSGLKLKLELNTLSQPNDKTKGDESLTSEPTYFKTYSHVTMSHGEAPGECSKIKRRSNRKRKKKT